MLASPLQSFGAGQDGRPQGHPAPWLSRWGWATVLAITLAIALIADLNVIEVLAGNTHFVGDFTVFWTAARADPSSLYDAVAMTVAQAPLVGGQPGLRPFVNPPTALPWLLPFGRLPFWSALACWTALSLTVFFLAARQYVRGWGLGLLALSPLVWISAATGQLSLLLGTALMTAVAVLPKKPVLAGILLGLAATVKPHVTLLVPLALVAAREWRALLAATASGAMIGLSSLAIQGPQLWLDWIAAARSFPALVEAERLTASGVAMSSLQIFGLPGWLLSATGMIFGAATIWIAFARTSDRHVRLIGLVTGCLLASPYARQYDLVALQPAVVVLLLNREGRPWRWLLGMIGLIGGGQIWSVIALASGVAMRIVRGPDRVERSALHRRRLPAL